MQYTCTPAIFKSPAGCRRSPMEFQRLFSRKKHYLSKNITQTISIISNQGVMKKNIVLYEDIASRALTVFPPKKCVHKGDHHKLELWKKSPRTTTKSTRSNAHLGWFQVFNIDAILTLYFLPQCMGHIDSFTDTWFIFYTVNF